MPHYFLYVPAPHDPLHYLAASCADMYSGDLLTHINIAARLLLVQAYNKCSIFVLLLFDL
jgi:hypothetical protein